jgi:predicted ATP-dependent Lon-type protease
MTDKFEKVNKVRSWIAELKLKSFDENEIIKEITLQLGENSDIFEKFILKCLLSEFKNKDVSLTNEDYNKCINIIERNYYQDDTISKINSYIEKTGDKYQIKHIIIKVANKEKKPSIINLNNMRVCVK